MRSAIVGALMLVALGASGCVERTMKIQSRPPGAIVVVNDEEVGVTPVKFSFLWYGDYDLVFRKDGFETLKTHYRVKPPWYEVPPIDFVSETLVAGTLHDDHTLPDFELTPASQPSVETVVERAVEMRERALFGGSAK